MKILKGKKYSIMSTILKYGFVFVIVFSIAMPFVFVNATSLCGTPNVTSSSAPTEGLCTSGSAKKVPFLDKGFWIWECGNDSCHAQMLSSTGSTTATGSPVSNIKIGITNPLGAGITDIPSFITAILNIVLVVGVPIVTLAIIYCGFLFVKAQGNPAELEKAKKTLVYTLIGAALLLGSFVIAQAIQGTVEEIKKTT